MIEDFVETRTGKRVSVQDPKPDQFDIKDIAYALSNTCRFNGHCAGFYSVAEHSVAVALRLPVDLRLAGLLHDATEAYLGDIPSPIKQFLNDYRVIERRFEEAIIRTFDLELTANDWQQVKTADIDALFTEAHFLIPSQGKDWTFFQGPVKHSVRYDLAPMCLPPQEAFKLFMGLFHKLTGDDSVIAQQATKIILPA